MTEAIDSLCPYCGVVCQVRYHLAGGRIVRADGLDGPANRGRLCVKGRFGFDYASHPDRLTVPLIRRKDAPKVPWPAEPRAQFREADWEEAIARAARGFLDIRSRHGAAALGGLGTAKGSNEEGYLLQKLVRTGFGSNHVDHCARLCHSSSVVALMDQLGSGAATAAFSQIENAEVALVVGLNPSRSFPVAGAIMRRAARQRGVRLIVVDPRRSEFADDAHLVLQPAPGADILLFNAIAQVIVAEALWDRDFVAARVDGFEAFRESLAPFAPEAVAEPCGVAADEIRAAARLFGGTRRGMIFWGMGITQHVHGVRNARCLVNLALLTGNVGRSGTGLHPMRGQNNVQGVSDMGVLPSFLPGYARVAESAARQRFEAAWRAPVPADPGLTVVEMMEAAAGGRIRGLYFMGENPAMSDPDIARVREALCRLEHLVVQDIFLTETAALADVVLPAGSMFEKWGSFTNTNRQIQLAQPVVRLPGAARDDLWILTAMARRLGLDWPDPDPAQIWNEIRSLWPAVAGVTWDRLRAQGTLQYPCPDLASGGQDVIFADRFATSTGRARLVPVEPAPPAELPDATYRDILLTGRMLEHWHTGVLSRRSAILDALEPAPFVAVSPAELAAAGVAPGEPIRLASRRGAISAPARPDQGLRPRTLFMSFCWSEAPANLLTGAALDPDSKIPEYKFTAVRLEPAGKDNPE